MAIRLTRRRAKARFAQVYRRDPNYDLPQAVADAQQDTSSSSSSSSSGSSSNSSNSNNCSFCRFAYIVFGTVLPTGAYVHHIRHPLPRAGWVVLNDSNLFPGEYPRRSRFSERGICTRLLNVCAIGKASPVVPPPSPLLRQLSFFFNFARVMTK